MFHQVRFKIVLNSEIIIVPCASLLRECPHDPTVCKTEQTTHHREFWWSQLIIERGCKPQRAWYIWYQPFLCYHLNSLPTSVNFVQILWISTEKSISEEEFSLAHVSQNHTETYSFEILIYQWHLEMFTTNCTDFGKL